MSRRNLPVPVLSDDLLQDLTEIESRVQACAAESRHLRTQRRRLFDPGYLYVAEFGSGVVKVGKAADARSRLRSHAKAGLVRSSWISLRHIGITETERQLIAFCEANGTLYGGREYFRDIAFAAARDHAELIVANALDDLRAEVEAERIDWADFRATFNSRCPS
jgi:hypothetical protein